MIGQCRPDRIRPTGAAILIAAVPLLSACSHAQHLGEYDFRGRTISAATIAPAQPEVLSGMRLHVDPDDPVRAVLRVSTEIAREATAQDVRSRLDRAASAVDVPARMSERVLRDGARQLRATPVAMPTGSARSGSDFEIEVRIRRYGIVASSWTAAAYFLVDADVAILDGPTGRRIWKQHVRATDPVRPVVLSSPDRSVGNAVTAIALASMSTEEIQRELELLADFAADRVTRSLADGLEDARN